MAGALIAPHFNSEVNYYALCQGLVHAGEWLWGELGRIIHLAGERWGRGGLDALFIQIKHIFHAGFIYS